MGAVVRVTTGTALVGLTVVMNVGDGIRGGKVSNTLAWGNTGRQMDGTASVAYSAASEMLTGMGNQLVDVSVEEAGRYFSNPTKVQGVIVGGYGTEVGTPAVFEPTCLLSSVVTRGSSAGSLSVDIRGVERGRGGGWDIGAFESTCLPSGDTVRYVRAGGTGRGLSWSDAAGDVQEMVDELYSRSGGQVWVAAGTYRHDGGSVSETVSTGLFGRTKITRYRHVNFVMREGVDVYGGFPADGSPGMSERQPMNVANRTILEPVELASNEKDDSKKEYKRGRVLEQQGDFTELTAWNGFTIQNGEISMDDTDDGGAGVKLMRNGLLENCYVTNNENKVTQRRSDGYWNSKNITLRGGGVNCLGGTLRNCYITENRATANTDGNDEAYGGGIYIKNGTVFNCVIVKNTCTGDYADGCAVFVEQADFYNNTISDNTGIKGTQSTAIRIGGFMEDSRLNVMNCIVWGNQVDYEILNENNKPNSITYSCFSGTVGGTNIAADPGFETGSYRLGVGSPCINAGNTYPESIVMPETDMDYTDRIKDCSVDIGAYEFGYNGTEPIHPWLSGDTARVCVTLYGAGMADGSSWENAVCRSKLQRAIDVLALRTEKVREIWVATGLPRGNDKHADVSADGFLKNAMFCPTFQEDVTDARTRSFRIKAGVAVIGGFRGNEKCRSERSFSPSPLTILSGDYLDTPEESGDDVYRVVVFDSIPPGQVARIEQLGIGYGNANHYINPVYQSGGGVVVTPGGRVVNCYIRKCLALQKGGGVYLAAQVGGSDGQRAMLSGSVVEKCEAGKGGGVYAGSWSVMTNNTIVGNKAVKGGGVDFDWPVAIQGTVIWGNEGDNGKNLSGVTRVAYMQGTDSLYPVNFCAVEGFRAEGNQNMALTPENEGAGRSPVFVDPENPLWFNGGLSLSVQSSLIDAGLNTSGVYTAFTAEELLKICALTDIDMAGNPRAHTYNVSNEGTFLDIGAYEAMGSVELVPDTRDRLYVTRRGRGRMDGSSWKHATSDLQAALDYFGKRMKKGEVWVQGGYTYIPMRRKKGETDRRAAFFILNPYVSLYGGFMGDTLEDAAAGRISESELEQRLHLDRNNNGVYEEYEFRYETVLDGGVNPTEGYSHNAYHVLYYEGGTVGDTVVVNGFTVQNGQSLCGSIGRFRSGGGLYAEGPVRVENCVFRNNFAVENGGALYAVAGGVVTGCLFGGNGVMLGRGGAVYLAGGLLANSLVTNNTSQGSGGGGVFLAGGGAVNCVIARNNNWTEGAGLLMRGGAVAVNTVVWGNAGGRQLTEVAGEGRLRFCALPDGRVSTGVVVENCIFLDEDNESADGPRFLRPTEEAVTEAYTWASDWRVHTLSPLTDAGDSTLYQAQRLPRELNYIAYVGSGGLTPVCRVRGRNIDVGYYENAPVELADCDTLYVRTWENPLQVADGSSWDRATSDLQAAIRKLEGRTGANRQIWVAQGNYAPTQLRGTATESRSFVIDRGGIAIYGGFPDDGVGTTRPDMEERNPERYITKLDGSCTRSAHVVYASKTESKTLIDGFTICGGNAAGTGTEGRGAALYVAGAAYQLYINHCVITDNEAVGEGAAVYSESQLAVTNSLVFRNRTSGLRSDYVRMVNNTFVANEGPGVQITGAATSSWGGVQNCVFWGNKGLQLYNRSGVVIDHCAVQDSLFAGVGNIRLNAENGADGGPRFRNPESVEMTGFRPDCGSVLADAGNEVYPSDIPMDHYDLSSRLRIMFSTIDIGAFESVKGKAPVRPEVGTEAVALCQGTTREVPVSNEVPDTKLYALYDTWEVLLTDKLVISGEHPGTQYYSVVRVDTTGCYSEADSIAVSVGMAVVPVGLSGTAEICAGEDAVLTFVPEAGHIYSLYDGGVEMRTGVTIGDGKLTVERPAVGEHHYSMQAAFGECVSERSAEVVVTVYEEGGITDGSALFPVSGTVLPGGCEGTEITDIVYRYEGAGGAEVTGLTAGLTVTLDKVAQTISIGGRVTEPVAYTVRTTGGGSTCSAARMTGVITVYPKPSFKFGKKK